MWWRLSGGRSLTGEYRHIATSREGFVQQVATSYVNRGYRFFVAIRLPDGKDPRQVDDKLIDRYGIAIDSGRRFRRKQRGLANLQYIRFGRSALLLATKGQHEFFQAEANNIRDCARVPMLALGYSIKYVRGGYLLKRLQEDAEAGPSRDPKHRVRVQIARQLYLELLSELVGQARRRREDWFRWRFWNIGFEPYAPVRKQLLKILKQVNAERKAAGLARVPTEVIRFRRRIVKPFEPQVDSEAGKAEAQTAGNLARQTINSVDGWSTWD